MSVGNPVYHKHIRRTGYMCIGMSCLLSVFVIVAVCLVELKSNHGVFDVSRSVGSNGLYICLGDTMMRLTLLVVFRSWLAWVVWNGKDRLLLKIHENQNITGTACVMGRILATGCSFGSLGLAWLGVFRMSLAILFSFAYTGLQVSPFSEGPKYSGDMAPERCTLLLDRMNG